MIKLPLCNYLGTIKELQSGDSISTDSNNNFSYEEIHTEITIPQYQQMIVMSEMVVENTLNLDGTIIMEI